MLRETRSTAETTAIDVTDIRSISLLQSNMVQLTLRDRAEREWLIRLPLGVLDGCLHRVSDERALVLCADTREDHARLTYPIRTWVLARDPGGREPTFLCRTSDGGGLEIAFSVDPVTAVPTLAVTIAAGPI